MQNGIFMSLLTASTAYYGDFGGEDPFGDARSGMLRIYNSVVELLQVVIVLAALVILARLVIKLMSGDKDSARSLLWWVIGLAFGFTMLSVLNSVL